MTEAQEHCRLLKKRLLTPVKTRFGYLVLSLHTLLENRKAINYLYRNKPGISNHIKKRKPTWQEWAVVEALIIVLKDDVGSTTVNQAKGDK